LVAAIPAHAREIHARQGCHTYQNALTIREDGQLSPLG
jgi:hypothetical protein